MRWHPLAFVCLLAGCLPEVGDETCFGDGDCAMGERCEAAQCVPGVCMPLTVADSLVSVATVSTIDESCEPPNRSEVCDGDDCRGCATEPYAPLWSYPIESAPISNMIIAAEGERVGSAWTVASAGSLVVRLPSVGREITIAGAGITMGPPALVAMPTGWLLAAPVAGLDGTELLLMRFDDDVRETTLLGVSGPANVGSVTAMVRDDGSVVVAFGRQSTQTTPRTLSLLHVEPAEGRCALRHHETGYADYVAISRPELIDSDAGLHVVTAHVSSGQTALVLRGIDDRLELTGLDRPRTTLTSSIVARTSAAARGSFAVVSLSLRQPQALLSYAVDLDGAAPIALIEEADPLAGLNPGPQLGATALFANDAGFIELFEYGPGAADLFGHSLPRDDRGRAIDAPTRLPRRCAGGQRPRVFRAAQTGDGRIYAGWLDGSKFTFAGVDCR